MINLARTIFNFQISEDGHRILVPSVAGSPGFQLIDLEKNRCRVVTSDRAPAALEPRIALPTANLRARFDAIHLPEAGGVCLRDRRGTWRELALTGGKNLSLSVRSTPPGETEIQRFEPLPLASSFPCRLKVASWPDGRRAWLDSRGLLHLKSADLSLPEISFMLSDNATAAWSSDGFMAGSPFFIPSSAFQMPAGQMMERIVQLTRGL